MEASSFLNSTQKYAASALFSLALHETQIHQTRPWSALKSLEDEDVGEGATIDKEEASVSENPNLWIHDSANLLTPVLKYELVSNCLIYGWLNFTLNENVDPILLLLLLVMIGFLVLKSKQSTG